MAERNFEMLSQLKRESPNNHFSKAFLLKQQPKKASLPLEEEKKKNNWWSNNNTFCFLIFKLVMRKVFCLNFHFFQGLIMKERKKCAMHSLSHFITFIRLYY